MDACNAQKEEMTEITMYNENQNPLNAIPQSTSKKSRLVIFGGVVLAFCGVTALLCHTFYSAQKSDILAAQEERLKLNVSSLADNIRIWEESLASLAARVSESGQFSLFASDIASMNAQDAKMLNDSEDAEGKGEDFALLVEQMPMMRTQLQDFTAYNGLHDARITKNTGSTLLSATPRPTPILESQVTVIKNATNNNKTSYAPVRKSTSGMMLDFAAPILAEQQEIGAKPETAFLVSINITGQLANYLSRGSGQSQDMHSNLLQYNGKNWEVLRSDSTTPIPDAIKIAADAKTIPFERREAVSGNGSVYSIGQRVNNLNWIVVQEISANLVDAQLSRAFNLVYGAGVFLCLSVLLMFSLVWWIMIGREQRTVAEQFRKLYQVIRKQKNLLDSINVSLDVGLIMADVSGKLHLVNRAFAEILDKKADELQDQNLHGIVSDKAAFQIQEAISSVSQSNTSKTIEIVLLLKGEERLFRATLFPFLDNEEETAAAVITMQDITEFRRNSEKRNKQQMSTIEALVGTIERVDPYLAGHSSLMRRLVELLADEMALEGKDKDTLTTAAVLSQIGRIFVPRELLSKTEKLTPEEQAELGRIPEYAHNILSTIDFGIPVPMAILQMNEKLDGTGSPKKLQGDEISLYGRVLSIINTFSAMVSPRAFRSSLPVDKALNILRDNKDAYDQNIVENLAVVLQSAEGSKAINARLTAVVPKENN